MAAEAASLAQGWFPGLPDRGDGDSCGRAGGDVERAAFSVVQGVEGDSTVLRAGAETRRDAASPKMGF